MEIVLTIIFGAFVGWLASIVTNRNAEQGWIGNVVVGVVGAFIGNAIGRAVDADPGRDGWSLSGLLFAFLGAVLLCVVLNLITRRRIR